MGEKLRVFFRWMKCVERTENTFICDMIFDLVSRMVRIASFGRLEDEDETEVW